MKPILYVLILVLCLGVATSAFAADSYLCIASKITGFIYEKNIKQCRSITEESNNIYFVERHRGAKYTWGVRKAGEAGSTYLCDEDFSESGYLLCGSEGDFNMNKHNLKYLISYLMGFCNTIDDDRKVTTEEGGDVSYIEIGRCHPL